ncbi:CPBP family intramembrane glutamic endopeptidase [Massilia sp. METH4]|uniref:CPBP family intramembrane glutamic endopeptidase n=1 Tax=Massilia sp. METH4 TaxID=3123041 RepID=UPI0030D53938
MTAIPAPTCFLAAAWLLAALSLWLPSPAARWPAWAPCLFLACLVGLVVGALLPAGAATVLVLAALCLGWQRQHGGVVQGVLLVAIAVLSLALALHAVPGFANPLLFKDVQVSPGAAPVSLYLNLDKAAAGILLCATFAAPAREALAWRRVGTAWPVIVLTPVVVLGTGVAVGFTAVEPKWLAEAPVFLVLNLFVTCLAEEAFFRALVQGRLEHALRDRRHGATLALALASVLFGIAHLGGGPVLAALATLAGIGYGLAWRRGGIEAAVLTHFAVNAGRFVLLTYPALK